MRPTGLIVALALMLSAVAATPANAPAHQRTEPSLTFAETSVSLTLDELRKGTRVTVLNQRTRTLRAQFRLSDLGLKPPSPPPDHISTAAAIPIESVSVPGASERNVLIRAPDLTVAPGVYKGRLAVYDTQTDSVARIPFVLDARASPEAAAKPAVDKLQDTATRDWPASTVDETVTVPLDASAGAPALHAGMTVGFLSGPDGHVAPVTVADNPSKVSRGVAKVKLKVSDLDRAGTFTGTVDLAPNDEKVGNLELSVGVRDAIWWPAIALLLGIIPALWRLHWTGAARPGFAVERRRAAAERAFNAAKRRFDRDAQNKPWASYNVDEAFTKANRNAEGIVERLASKSFDELDADLVKDADEAIAGLDAASISLRSLNEALPKLEAGLKTIEGLARIQGLPGPPQPAFAMSAREPANGREARRPRQAQGDSRDGHGRGNSGRALAASARGHGACHDAGGPPGESHRG